MERDEIFLLILIIIMNFYYIVQGFLNERARKWMFEERMKRIERELKEQDKEGKEAPEGNSPLTN